MLIDGCVVSVIVMFGLCVMIVVCRLVGSWLMSSVEVVLLFMIVICLGVIICVVCCVMCCFFLVLSVLCCVNGVMVGDVGSVLLCMCCSSFLVVSLCRLWCIVFLDMLNCMFSLVVSIWLLCVSVLRIVFLCCVVSIVIV